MLCSPAARRAAGLGLLAALALACGAPEAPAVDEAPAARPRSAWIEIGGELFELELAADAGTRFRGLSGRSHIPRSGGMLFVFEGMRPRAMVMRDCPVPIDVAFLNESGRVVGLHAMRVEPARKPGESPGAYEARLPLYTSGGPARFAVEVAGGRLAELGVSEGDLLVFDAARLAKLTE